MTNECGLGSWCRPRWLARFATPRWFLVIYGILGTTQAMAFIYFVATLTTLEKRFKIPSRTTGIVMSGNEISQIMLSLFLSYYGGRGNRPRWIAYGVGLSAISCFILALPHFIYGAGNDALALTEEYLDMGKLMNGSTTNKVAAVCSTTQTQEVCSQDEYSMFPVVIVFMSQFVLGIGTTLFFALGQTYLDDSTKKTKTPMLLGLVLALRSVGPAVGFILGSACLKIFIDPSLTPVIDNTDPRWLGAWWLGWIILGIAMILIAFLIALFPAKMPQKATKSPIVRADFILPVHVTKKSQLDNDDDDEEDGEPLTTYLTDDFMPKSSRATQSEEEYIETLTSLPKISTLDRRRKETLPKLSFMSGLKRLLKNKILMSNNVAAVFYILGASGYITFYPKYMESQFQTSAASASMVAGTTTILAMSVGFLLSGVVISKFKPSPRILLGWNVIVGFGYVIGEISFIFIGCHSNNLQGTLMTTGSLNLTSDCNTACNCEHLKYTPVCLEPRMETYYSPCHAGCTTMMDVNSTLSYSNCDCAVARYNEISNSSVSHPLQSSVPDHVASGPCFVDCAASFYWFLGVTCLMHAMGSSGRIGNILVNYRCVIPEDKPFAQGLGLLMISLFAFIPGPIIYGAIIDSTCLVWNDSCGYKGNCWLYDKDNFRLYLNATAATLTTIAVFFDIIVWYLGKGLNLYSEPGEETK